MKQLLLLFLTLLFFSCRDTGTSPGNEPPIKDIGISKDKYVIPFYDTEVYLISQIKYYFNNVLITEHSKDTVIFRNLNVNDQTYEASILDYPGGLIQGFQIELTYNLSTGALTSMGQEFTFTFLENKGILFTCKDHFDRVRIEGSVNSNKINFFRYYKYDTSGDVHKYEVYILERVRK